MVVIRTFKDRGEALTFERSTVLSLNESGKRLLNNNYTDTCTRVGVSGAKNPTSKRYVFVDFGNKTAQLTGELRLLCEKNGLCYKSVIATAKGKEVSYKNRYLVRYESDWESFTDEEKKHIVNGDWVAERRKKQRQRLSNLYAKEYLVRTPTGDEIKVRNLDKFAESVGVNKGNLHASFSSPYTAGGYKVIQKL